MLIVLSFLILDVTENAIDLSTSSVVITPQSSPEKEQTCSNEQIKEEKEEKIPACKKVIQSNQ